ncbi:unnamed protein product, partial [Mesorhabditis spiculigera]
MSQVDPEDHEEAAGEAGDPNEQEKIAQQLQEEIIRRAVGKSIELVNVDRYNTLLHQLYTQKDYDGCKELISELMDTFKGECDYAIYIRSVICREECDLEGCLEWCNKGLALNSSDPKYIMQIGRVQLLQGNHTTAVEFLERAVHLDKMNYKAYFWLARAVYHLDTNLFDPATKAKDILLNAPVLHHSSELLIFLAKLFTQLGEIQAAIQTYRKAIEMEPENIELMSNLGMLYLRAGSEEQAFAMFGRALSFDPAHAPSILAAGSVMQSHGDHEVALNKYRVAAEKCDYNGCLWNNIGVCLFAKGKYVAAISCLKKAAYLCPLEHRILYNLGLVHNAMQQYCSAYHFLAAAMALSPRNPQVFGALAVVLSAMQDPANAEKAYVKAMSLKPNAQTILNFAISTGKAGKHEMSMALLDKYKEYENANKVPPVIKSLAQKLEHVLTMKEATAATPEPSQPAPEWPPREVAE